MRLTLRLRTVAIWTTVVAATAFAIPAQALAADTLEVEKVLVPADDGGRFDLHIDQGTTAVAVAENVGNGGSTGPQTVTPGVPYQVSESAAGESSARQYARTIVCRNQAGAFVARAQFAPLDPASQGPIDVTVASGDDVKCVITNSRIGTPTITEFTGRPESLPNLQVPDSELTQAGAHPNMRIKMRFCGRTPNPADKLIGCTPIDMVTPLKDFRLGLPAGMIGNPTAILRPCPYHLFLAFACPADTAVGYSFTRAIAGNSRASTIYSAPTPLFILQTLGWEPARLGTSLIPTVPPGPVPIVVSVRTADDPATPERDEGDFGIDSLVANIPASPPSAGVTDIGAIPLIDIDTVLCSRVPCIATTTDVTQVGPVPGTTRPFLVNPTSCKPARFDLEAVGWDATHTSSRAVSNLGPPSIAIKSSPNGITGSPGGLVTVNTDGPHGLTDGTDVDIVRALAADGTPLFSANGLRVITVVDEDSFTLNGSVFSAPGGGGTVFAFTKVDIQPSPDGITSTDDLITVNTTAPHGLRSGTTVKIDGSSVPAANGFKAVTVLDGDSFTLDATPFTVAGGGGTSSGYAPRQTPEFSTTGCDDVNATAATPVDEAPTEDTGTDADTDVDPPFNLNVDFEPASNQAGAAGEFTVRLRYPPGYADDPVWQANLRHADVTLPDGVTLAAAGGNGLEACEYEEFYGPNVHDSTAAEYRKRTDDPVKCPAGSQIGRIYVETPALADPIEGKAFFGPAVSGRATDASPWKLFLLLEGQGLRIKLTAGDVSVSETGRIRTVFKANPEVPFEVFELTTNGGPNAVLANPTTCGTHTGRVVLTSWGDLTEDTPTVIREPTLDIEGCQDPQPFQPVINDASAKPEQAGASSVSHLNFKIPDGHQDLRTLTLHLPPGAVGSLAAVPLCPAATVNALASNPSLNCPDSSKVGTIRTTVGSGSALLTAPGKIYIGEAVKHGDAASFVIVVPAKTGPIDLGRVVLVNRAVLRPSDSGVDVFADEPIPNILHGVPLPIREIDILVDREGFFLNPTSCATHNFVADFTAYGGGSAQSTFPTTATGCGNLKFAPKLRIIAGGPGRTGNQANPDLTAIVTQGPGESNIANARVLIPDIIRPDVPQIQKPGTLCMDPTGRNCPPTSQIGTAQVITPVLPFKLSGPVYITLQLGQPLPNLVVFLRGPGGLEVVLRAANGFQGIRILNTFANVPDVPQSRFELKVNGGANGILLNYKNLCTTNPLPTIDAQFIGHNGATYKDTPRIEAAGCVGSSGGKGAYISKRSVKMSRSGNVPVRITCAGRVRRCSGRVTIGSKRKASSSATFGRKSYTLTRTRGRVNVKLSKKTQRRVRRAKRIRALVTVTTNNGPTSRRMITIRR